MPTYHQLTKTKWKPKKKINKVPALEKCPQKRGICTKVVLRTPRKPNSAKRRLVKVWLSNRKHVYAHIPGEGNNLQEFSNVLLQGGSVNDLPGIKYRVIRGKLDLSGLRNRKTSRSKYGTKDFDRYL